MYLSCQLSRSYGGLRSPFFMKLLLSVLLVFALGVIVQAGGNSEPLDTYAVENVAVLTPDVSVVVGDTLSLDCPASLPDISVGDLYVTDATNGGDESFNIICPNLSPAIDCISDLTDENVHRKGEVVAIGNTCGV